MSTVGEYRRNAADCIELAKVVTDPTRKLAILDMAQAWQRLAEQAEANESLRADAVGHRVSDNP